MRLRIWGERGWSPGGRVEEGERSWTRWCGGGGGVFGDDYL